MTEVAQREIAWTVVQPTRGDEKIYHFDTQVEAQEKLFNLFTTKLGEDSYYGITILATDVFIKWEEGVYNYIDFELDEMFPGGLEAADAAREHFVG